MRSRFMTPLGMVRSAREFQEALARKQYHDWVETQRKEASTMSLEELEKSLAAINEKIKNTPKTSTLTEAVKAAAEQANFLQLKDIVQAEIIRLKTGLPATQYWRLASIKRNKDRFRVMTKREGKYAYNCESCHAEIKGKTYQLGQKHIYVCPECWHKYIIMPDSPLEVCKF